MRKLGVAAALALAVAASACGGSHDEPLAAHDPTPADLEVMLVPKQELGALASGLRLDPDSSGPTSNREAADDSIDPRDTARAVARAGRILGHDVTFSARRRPGALGILALAQGVELFRTERDAARYLKKQFADFQRFRGRTFDGVRLASVERFDVAVGEQARGVHLRLVRPTDGAAAFLTFVGFQRGRVVGAAALLLRQQLQLPDDAERLADGIDDRVRNVISGTLRARASARRQGRAELPDPKPLTLAADALPLRARLHGQSYSRGRGLRAYLREYDVVGGRLAGSKVFYLRTMAKVFVNPSAAVKNRRYLASARGCDATARRFLRVLFRGTSARPRGVSARPLSSGARDTVICQFFFRAPRGRIEGLLLSVDRGRFSASVLVMGLDREVQPAAVLAAREKLRHRLAA